ncbi:hypothetical protein D6850_16055 [Roseovarius spongiae]|uniref:Sel1 repeat family protein n=2 Tax=Roseovarius spongiae TaxID=2320272 RepID=A0A3A8ATU0_9RHOB|nr:hypothetical protein D6850_16055 [Roseovarius spongiae]
MKSAILAAMLGATLAGPASAQGDPRPSLMDVITPDNIAGSLASLAISGLRTQMEVEYEHLATDVMRGVVTLSGVTLRPQLPYDQARQCEVSVERIGFDLGQPALGFTAWSASVTVVGARANMACVEREVGLALRSAGYTELEVDRLIMEADYLHGSGEIRMNGSATVKDMTTIDLAATGAILPRLSQYGGPGDPAIRVRRAILGIEDHGGWNRLSALIPENLRQPDVIKGLGTEELTNMLGNGGARALTATERRFIDDLMSHVADFIREPSEITIEAQLPPGGIVIEPELYESPADLLLALAPDARTAPLAQSQLVDGALLARIDDDSLTDGERLDLARALLSGTGVPRAEALVPDLLAPVANAQGDDAAQAALLTARAQLPFAPAEAYRNALAASSARLKGAIPLLDALEAQLTTADVITAQDAHLVGTGAASPADALGQTRDIRAVRRLALAHFTGLDAPRSYRMAYYYALIAEAAGDIGATPLREDIEARFAGRGAEVAALWTALRAKIQRQALSDWIALDLADRFGRDD